MPPYFEHTTILIGPLTVYLWGLFIACGIAAMLLVSRREAPRYRVSFDTIADLSVWVLIAAFVGARLSHVFLYDPGFYFAHPVEILKLWNGGMSSLGGMVFGTATAIIFVWRRRLDVRAVGDVLFRTMPIAWAIGRFGCYVTHMHPGMLTTRAFGVAYPDGGRWDLGLLESAVWIVIGCVVWLLPRSTRSGFYLVLVPLLYAPARFALDFLRVDDTRYAGLTPAQYGMILLFVMVVAIGLKWKIFRRKI